MTIKFIQQFIHIATIHTHSYSATLQKNVKLLKTVNISKCMLSIINVDNISLQTRPCLNMYVMKRRVWCLGTEFQARKAKERQIELGGGRMVRKAQHGRAGFICSPKVFITPSSVPGCGLCMGGNVCIRGSK